MSVFDEKNPLHLAVERRDVSQLKELLSSGEKPDSRTSAKITPLMVAAKRGFDDIVEVLLDAGANPNAKDSSSSLDEGRLTALHLAAENGRASTCRILLEHAADPNSTPLNYVCHSKSLAAVEQLLKHGADPNESPKC
jgi:uncharacterized protein